MLEQLYSHQRKKHVKLVCILYMKINSRCIKNVKAKKQNYKSARDNITDYFCYL